MSALKLTVHNIGPVASAEILIGDGITLIGAINEAGKSTLLASAAGALTGNPLFLPAITTKKDAGLMLRDGAKSGRIALIADEGDVVMVYPAASVESHGAAPPGARPNAVGRAPFLALSEKDRAKVLSAMLRTEPGKDELEAALRADGIADEDIGDILGILEGNGWDGGHDFVGKKWTEEKGAWAQITKAGTYGAAKGAAWSPAEWTADLETATLEELELAAAQAKTALDHARANMAVDQAEIARLTDLAATLRDRKVIADELAAAAQAIVEQLAAAEQEKATVPSGEEEGQPCPHCSQPVVARPNHPGRGYTLHKADPISGEALHQRRLKMAGLDGTIGRLNGERGTANKKVIEATSAVKEAEDAGKRLADLKKGKKGDSAADGAAVTKAERDHNRAALRLNIKMVKVAADEKHAAIALLEKVRAHFAPDGLRQVKLANALTAFCEGPLRELSDAAGWPAVVIRPDMSLTSGGHVILSESAQWRAETLLSVAFARLGGSPLVILDRADVNDADHREGLIGLLEHTGLKALVGMTISKRDRMPDLAAAGIGRSYWIEAGKSETVGAEKKAAA